MPDENTPATPTQDASNADFGVVRTAPVDPSEMVGATKEDAPIVVPPKPADAVEAPTHPGNNGDTPSSTETVLSVSERLSQQGGAEAAGAVEDAPIPMQPIPFDLGALRPEQLQQLKQLLEATPLRAKKVGNPIVSLRKYTAPGSEEERIIIDFKNAKVTYVRDEVALVTKEVLMIPVRFLDGGEDFVNIEYRDFINAHQFQCEVVATRRVPGGYDEGEVWSQERKALVPMHVETQDDFFTVKLPDGRTVELPVRIVNA